MVTNLNRRMLRFASGADDGEVRIWDALYGESVSVTEPHALTHGAIQDVAGKSFALTPCQSLHWRGHRPTLWLLRLWTTPLR